MALANFFGKNALAAAQILGGMTPDTLSGILNRQVVAIAFDDAAARTEEGRTAIELTANLAARLYPSLSLVPLGRSLSRGLAERLEAQVRAINPDIYFVADVSRVTMAVVVGTSQFPAPSAGPRPFVTYAGSSEWYARLSPDGPVGSGDSGNPFGAAAAACFALANVFRAVFSEHLSTPEPDSSFALSLFDFHRFSGPEARVAQLPAGGPALRTLSINLDETILGGVGAIGNAAVWVLARVPRLTGALVLVDDQAVTLSNLQRYVLTTQPHPTAETKKVALAAAVLRDAAAGRGESALRVLPEPFLWGEYLRRR